MSFPTPHTPTQWLRHIIRGSSRLRKTIPTILLTLICSFTWTQPLGAQLTAQGRQWLEGFSAEQRKGEALAFCDFNGDGYDDLAVGLPGATIFTLGGPLENAGSVRIFFGNPTGTFDEELNLQSLRQGSLLGGDDAAGALFGSALAAADFDLDGACDLAIGIPGANVSGLVAAGRVAVVSGVLGDELDRDSAVFFDQDVLTGTPGTGHRFGSVLSAGAIGANPFPDLVVGVPDETLGDFDNAGIIHIITSRNENGLGLDFDARLHQDTTDMFGVAGPDDRFGASLAIGDATGDGVPDLVVGSPGDRVGMVQGAGAVQVIPGGESGVILTVEEQQMLNQDVDDVLGNAAEGDAFGQAVSLGHFNGDTFLDLAVGVPGESQFGPEQSGAVQVFYGTASGFSVDSEQILFESLISPEIATFDRFGQTLASGDFNGDGHDELAVGFPLDNVFGIVNAGNVAVLYGAPGGLQTTGAQLWNGLTLLTVEPGDEIGFSLAVGRVRGDRFGRYLAIGAPGRQGEDMDPHVGGVILLPSQIPVFTDGFETGGTSNWSSAAP